VPALHRGRHLKITPHFSLGEFERPARPKKGFPTAAPYPAEWIESRLRPLCEALEIVRARIGKPIRIISGYRDPAYNAAIGGARKSQHMAGMAVDVVVDGMRASAVHRLVLGFHEGGEIIIGGLGLYENFVHIDIRTADRLVRWKPMNEKIQSLALAYARAFEKSSVATAKADDAHGEANVEGCRAVVARERLKEAICDANSLSYEKPRMPDIEGIAKEKV
jgi:hypothetical protein